MATIRFLVVLIFALSVFVDGKILKCHQCDPKTECESNDDNLMDCKNGELFCVIHALSSKNETFTRGCVSSDKFCDNLKETACGTCQKDGCNSASSIGSTAIGITTLLILKSLADRL